MATALSAPGFRRARRQIGLHNNYLLSAAILSRCFRGCPDPGKAPKNSSPVPFSNPGIAGFIVAEPEHHGSGHVITIDVIATARRSGVGSLLLRSAEDRLRAAGSSSIELETAVDNVSALSFYKRHGYSVIRTFPHYYSNGVDALVLNKALEFPR